MKKAVFLLLGTMMIAGGLLVSCQKIRKLQANAKKVDGSVPSLQPLRSLQALLIYKESF